MFLFTSCILIATNFAVSSGWQDWDSYIVCNICDVELRLPTWPRPQIIIQVGWMITHPNCFTLNTVERCAFVVHKYITCVHIFNSLSLLPTASRFNQRYTELTPPVFFFATAQLLSCVLDLCIWKNFSGSLPYFLHK